MSHPPIILTVSDLTNALKSHIEPMFRHVCVQGEISNYKIQSSGHQYFSLIDSDAQLSAVLFKGDSLRCTYPLKNGDTVTAAGEISLYPPRGSYQLIVRQISHVGIGAALLRLQALKKKLHELGWFRTERKRALPSEIRKIGLVTSPSGAVLHDIYTILCRRMGCFHLIINPVRVQGEGSAREIARAIAEFSEHSLVDVIIVCRGGGSCEDLAAFNEEVVAKACFESKIPVISAVGHETDFTIVDLVADLRAPTPSAAAELVSKERGEHILLLSKYHRTIPLLMQNRIELLRRQISLFLKRILHIHPRKKIEVFKIQFDETENRTKDSALRLICTKRRLLEQLGRSIRQLSPSARVLRQRLQFLQAQKSLQGLLHRNCNERREKFKSLRKQLTSIIFGRLTESKKALFAEKQITMLLAIWVQKVSSYHAKLSFFASQFEALNPRTVLKRGYAIVFTENTKKVVRSIHDISSNDSVKIVVCDGSVRATIQERLPNE